MLELRRDKRPVIRTQLPRTTARETIWTARLTTGDTARAMSQGVRAPAAVSIRMTPSTEGETELILATAKIEDFDRFWRPSAWGLVAKALGDPIRCVWRRHTPAAPALGPRSRSPVY
jgi:hypothetical protein